MMKYWIYFSELHDLSELIQSIDVLLNNVSTYAIFLVKEQYGYMFYVPKI